MNGDKVTIKELREELQAEQFKSGALLTLIRDMMKFYPDAVFITDKHNYYSGDEIQEALEIDERAKAVLKENEPPAEKKELKHYRMTAETGHLGTKVFGKDKK